MADPTRGFEMPFSPTPPSQTNGVNGHLARQRQRRAAALVELLPRDGAQPSRSPAVPLMPSLRRGLHPDDALTAPITRDLPVQRAERWAWWQVAWAGLLWSLLAAAAVLILAVLLALALFVGALAVLAVAWASQWVPPPVLVVGVLTAVCVVLYLRSGEGEP